MKIVFIIFILLFSSNFVYSNNEIKAFRTNEIIIISQDKQIEKSTSYLDLIIENHHQNKYFFLDNLLNEVTGLRSIRNSKNEGYFRLRGLDQRQIGIYFDGIPIVNQFDGMVDLSQFSLLPVSKVSVSKGISSTLYGANNLGGSINFVTDNIFLENSINASINVGNISKNYGIQAKQRLKGIYFSLFADYNDFNNFQTSSKYKANSKTITNSYSESYSLFAKFANQLTNNFIHTLSFMISYGEKGIPVNLEASKKRYWKMPEWNNALISYAINYEMLEHINIKTNFFATRFKNIIDAYDDSTFSTQKTRSAFHSTQEYSKFGFSSILEINRDNFEQTKFAFSLHNDHQHQQSNINEQWKDFRSQLISLSVEQNLSFGNFGGFFGYNYDKLIPKYANGSQLRPSDDFLNHQAGINYSNDMFTVFINYSHKSRFPTLKEFYAEVIGANKPNPNLKSEFSNNYEIGFKSNYFSNLSLRSSIYANYVKNLIDITILEDNSRQFINIGKVYFAGVEFDAQYNLNEYLINFSFNYQKSENQTKSVKSKIMPLRPEFITNLTLSHYFDSGIGGHIQMQSYFNQFAYNADKKLYFKLPDYNLLNVLISYKIFKNLSLNATFLNILDELYYSDWGYPQLGFNFNFGIRLNY